MSATGHPTPIRSHLLDEDPELRDIVTEFVSGLDGRLAELHEAFGRLDFGQLKTLAHRLKGAGGSYGYPELSKIAATLEEQFRQFQADNVESLLEDLAQLVAAAKAGLELGQ